jgi:hypothetical protein
MEKPGIQLETQTHNTTYTHQIIRKLSLNAREIFKTNVAKKIQSA